MLSACCYFRGNYLGRPPVERLLAELCADPDLVPERWNIFEPINIPFGENLDKVVRALTTPTSPAVNTGVFFIRKKPPRYLLTISLRLVPWQWTTPHNSISFDLEAGWPGGEDRIADYFCRSVLPRFPDFAYVTDETPQDKERFAEFKRSYTPKEFQELISKKEIVLPFGPFGCLGDIYWFNYFGRVYVEFIGKERLMSAGWARVEEVGDGLACYASEDINEPNLRARRSRIITALEDVVWTPGSNRAEKRIPSFDFSEQLSLVPEETRMRWIFP